MPATGAAAPDSTALAAPPDLPAPSAPLHYLLLALDIAANVDMIVIVFAPMPEPHANLIDRYLVAAEHAGIRPLLLLNKADLIEQPQRRETLIAHRCEVNGKPAYRFDIYIQGPNETVFFDF